MSYAVRTDVFEGPFDVLLRLITERQVDLYEVRLSDIVDSYLAELAAMESLDLEVATEFLLIAAILVELKSRRLLPDRDGRVSEDDLALFEERDYLLARLVECTTFSAAGRRLYEIERVASKSFPRLAGPDERFEGIAPDLLSGVTPGELAEAAGRALAERPVERVDVEHVHVDEVTVGEVVERLALFLPSSGPVTFRQLTARATTTMEVAIHFVALLELYKQDLIDLDQPTVFGELTVTWTGGAGEGDELALDAARRARVELVDAEYLG